MKHLLNNLTEQEKKSILSQHKGSIKVVTESFFKNINAKSGDVRPLMEQEPVSKPINKTEPTPQPINKTEPTPQPINKTEPTPPIPPTPQPKIQTTFPFFVNLRNKHGKDQPYDVTKLYGMYGYDCQFGVRLRGTKKEYDLFYTCSKPGEVHIKYPTNVLSTSFTSENFEISQEADATFKYHCECEKKYVQNTNKSSSIS